VSGQQCIAVALRSAAQRLGQRRRLDGAIDFRNFFEIAMRAVRVASRK
jgi:hypothetical protein